MTLTDIAVACDLAASTVSRAMSNPNRVSAETYERIVRKAHELGYESATLPEGRSRTTRGTIALLVPNLSNPFNLELIRGSQAQAQAAGFMQLLVTSDESEQIEVDWLVELSQNVDGVVVSTPRCSDELLHQIRERVPLVVLNREVQDISGVVLDTATGMKQALEYLVTLGHQRIAYVRGPATSWTDQTRFLALLEAAEELSVSLTPVGAFRPTLSAGAAAADAVTLAKVTAAIFFNDTLAIGALDRFKQQGIQVPGDVSVVGCDDIFGASFTSPPLTTITTSGEQAGRTVTDMLLSSFMARKAPHRIYHIPAHLTVRESTGAIS